MDIGKILQDLKGKVLDAGHFDLLKHAYDLQEENIKQLKTNNEALKESNLLLQLRIEELEHGHSVLQSENENLASKVPKQKEIQLSELAIAVLNVFAEEDRDKLIEDSILSGCDYSNVQVKAGVSELQDQNIIGIGVGTRYGTSYRLTSQGKQIVARMG